MELSLVCKALQAGDYAPCRCMRTIPSMHSSKRRSVLLVQLPIPPLGPGAIRGNVPLAAAYLKLYAQKKGLDPFYEIGILPGSVANTLGDQALVATIARSRPWMVSFPRYAWNIERKLWVAGERK